MYLLYVYVFSDDMSAEKCLIRQLLQRYQNLGRNGRPVRNVNDTVDVEFGLGLIQMELDEKSKVLKMSMWSRYVSTTKNMGIIHVIALH